MLYQINYHFPKPRGLENHIMSKLKLSKTKCKIQNCITSGKNIGENVHDLGFGDKF